MARRAYFSRAEIAERRRIFAVLVERGLVEVHPLDDGSAGLTFPKGEDHPEVVAFNAVRNIH